MSAEIEKTLREAKAVLKAGRTDVARDMVLKTLESAQASPKAKAVLTDIMKARMGMPPRPFRDAHLAAIAKRRAAVGNTAILPDMLALVRLNPDNARALGFFGALLLEAGHRPVARKWLLDALKIEPFQAEATINLARSLIDDQRPDLAIARLRPLLERQPDYGPALDMLAWAQHASEDYEAEAESTRKLLAIDPGNDNARLRLGTALSHTMTGSDEALAILNDLAKRSPQNAQVWNSLGNLLVAQGQMRDASIAFEKALGINPNSGTIYYNLSGGITFHVGDPRIDAMLTLSGSLTMPAGERTLLEFALAKALEDVKRDEESFAHLEKANKLRRAELTYSTDVKREVMRLTTEAFGHNAPAAQRTPIPCTPIFVLGMMRSGTTLTEQILSNHSQVTGAGELMVLERLMNEHLKPGDFRLTSEQMTDIRNRYTAELARLAPGAPYVVDKLPANFRWIGVIRKAIPEARIIHMNRDPMAICWSIFKIYFPSTENGYCYTQDELAAFYGLYAEMMERWRKEYPGEFLDVTYEKLTEEPREQVARILSFCGLPFEEGCLTPEDNKRAVFTASARQVRSGIYKGSSKAWERWEQWLGPLKAGLAPYMG